MTVGIDRRLLLNIDWLILGTSLTLASIGLALIASATQVRRAPLPAQAIANQADATAREPAPPPPRQTPRWVRQVGAISLAFVAFLAVLAVDYRRLADRAPLLYIASAIVLLGLLLFGHPIAGTRRWLTWGALQLQPSELIKLIAALVVARAFAESRKESLDLRDILGPGAATALLALLIALEPDLGTAFCLVPMFFAVAFLGGLRPRALLALALVMGLAAGGLGWTFAKGYQKQRLVSYVARHVNPEGWLGRQIARHVPLDAHANDQRGAGYQSRQSRIAVGSGGFLGRGYGKGGQSQLGYLPARHTDFIFSVLAEEFGFVGVSVVLGLYLTFFWRTFETARHARDRLGALLVAGLASMMTFQVIYNIAMVAGMVPIKGLPLPLLSYGGSSTLSTFMAIGLILNVRMRRFAN
jgi:rod shape determining protein RodA